MSLKRGCDTHKHNGSLVSGYYKRPKDYIVWSRLTSIYLVLYSRVGEGGTEATTQYFLWGKKRGSTQSNHATEPFLLQQLGTSCILLANTDTLNLGFDNFPVDSAFTQALHVTVSASKLGKVEVVSSMRRDIAGSYPTEKLYEPFPGRF